jgi:hypothetical protein
LGENPEENGGFEISGAESGAVRRNPAPLLPRELAELIQAWPALRPEIRAAIVALMQTGRA